MRNPRVIRAIDEYLAETARHRKLNRGDPGAYFALSPEDKADADVQRQHRKVDAKSQKSQSSALRRGSSLGDVGRDGIGRAFAGVSHSAAGSAYLETGRIAGDMSPHVRRRVAKAAEALARSRGDVVVGRHTSLPSGSVHPYGAQRAVHDLTVDHLRAAGVPDAHIVGPYWKLHTEGGQPKSPKDSLKNVASLVAKDRGHGSPGDATFGEIRRYGDEALSHHLGEAGIDYDDLRHEGDFSPSARLRRHLDALPASPAVSDVKKVAKAHLAEVAEETRQRAESDLHRGLPHADDVAERPLKGLPHGYREATHLDAPMLSKWCAKTNACLARAVAGEFGEGYVPHRVVLSTAGHVVGLRKVESAESAGDGNGHEGDYPRVKLTGEPGTYKVTGDSQCCDAQNKADPVEKAKFDAARITEYSPPQPEEGEDKPRRAGYIPRSWAMRALRRTGTKPSRVYDI